jgi:hypothetical protein
MKLSIEEIQFVDNYLKNSGVFYIDIRTEMLDHVATAVESKMQETNMDFYDAFKEFMVKNKKELMKNNREGFGYYDPKIFKEAAVFLLKPWSLIRLLIILSLTYTLVETNIGEAIQKIFLALIFVVILAWAIGLYAYRKLYLKGERFFVLEQSGIFFFIIFHIFNPLFINIKVLTHGNFWLYGLYFYFILNALFFQIYCFKKNQDKLSTMIS